MEANSLPNATTNERFDKIFESRHIAIERVDFKNKNTHKIFFIYDLSRFEYR